MFVKHRLLRTLLAAAAGAVCLYTGISCAAAWHRAAGQPFLLSGTVRYDFLGYGMLAGVHGALCLASALVLALLLLCGRKRKK